MGENERIRREKGEWKEERKEKRSVMFCVSAVQNSMAI